MLIALHFNRQIVFAERREVISAGNFHGEYPAKVRSRMLCDFDTYRRPEGAGGAGAPLRVA